MLSTVCWWGRCFRQPADQPRDRSECRDSMKLSGLPLRHQLPSLTFDFAPVAYYPTPFASPDPSCFPPLSFTCVSCLGAFEAAKLGINRYQCSPTQWKCCLIKCCCLTAPIIAFETVLALYPWKDFMFTSCGSLQKMLLLTLWCHYIHSKYGAKKCSLA